MSERDSEQLQRDSRVKAVGKLIADMLDEIGVETEQRSKPLNSSSGPIDEVLTGWTILDSEDIGMNTGVFLTRNGLLLLIYLN